MKKMSEKRQVLKRLFGREFEAFSLQKLRYDKYYVYFDLG